MLSASHFGNAVRGEDEEKRPELVDAERPSES